MLKKIYTPVCLKFLASPPPWSFFHLEGRECTLGQDGTRLIGGLIGIKTLMTLLAKYTDSDSRIVKNSGTYGGQYSSNTTLSLWTLSQRRPTSCPCSQACHERHHYYIGSVFRVRYSPLHKGPVLLMSLS